ncbi:MAG: threonine synthase [Candidatus Bathyarchaeia archaeon]
MQLECIACGERYRDDEVIYACRRCGGLLDVRYDYGEVSRELGSSGWRKRPLGVWRYRELLPLPKSASIISLSEGGTALIPSRRLGEDFGLKHLYVKNEGENPTGSFKDRGMTVGVSKALQLGARTVICASTGNTSASLAAYAARAGLNCVVLIPAGRVALGKVAQAVMHGAKVVAVKGSFDDALAAVRELAEELSLYLLNSINPFRLEGQKTAAYEVWDQLGERVPDKVILPVGNAGNISAYWKGFKELQILGLAESRPAMVGVQAEGAPPVAEAFEAHAAKINPVPSPRTVATAIRIGNPVNWKKALTAMRESGGDAETVTDAEILEAQQLLARREGIFTEPAGAASIAALRKLRERGVLSRDDVVICVATGHGLKDPEIALKSCAQPTEAEASIETLRRAIGV